MQINKTIDNPVSIQPVPQQMVAKREIRAPVTPSKTEAHQVNLKYQLFFI
jgi:hypothetical protein